MSSSSSSSSESSSSSGVKIIEKFLPLFEYDGTLAVLEGSTRSGKTHSILQCLVTWCLNSPLEVFACRHDGTTCRPTIVRDFQDIMLEEFGIWGTAGKWNDKRMEYRFHNGSRISFGGTNDPRKLHGQEQDILWLNEVMEISYSAWKQLTYRTRVMRICDFNPSLTHHWLFDRVMSKSKDSYLYIHSTYKDNPFLPPAQVAEIESSEPTPENIAAGTADAWHWQVYGLGQRARREGAIFEYWGTTDEWPDKMACERHGYGLDFGYSSDPTALVECALFQDTLHLRQVVYEKKLLIVPNKTRPGIRNLHDVMIERGVSPDSKIYADSSNPEAIRNLSLCGWNVIPSRKGPNSIRAGIDLLKMYRMLVDLGSIDLQKELENYVWDKDKPVDAWNHGIDGVRYWAERNLKVRRHGGVFSARFGRGVTGVARKARSMFSWGKHAETSARPSYEKTVGW